MCTIIKVLLKISQNLQESTRAGVSFLIKFALNLLKDTPTQVFSFKICKIFQEHFIRRASLVAASENYTNFIQRELLKSVSKIWLQTNFESRVSW